MMAQKKGGEGANTPLSLVVHFGELQKEHVGNLAKKGGAQPRTPSCEDEKRGARADR